MTLSFGLIAILGVIALTIFVIYWAVTSWNIDISKNWRYDNSRQEIDGEFYREGPWWNVSSVGLVPNEIIISFIHKDMIEDMASAAATSYGQARVYNTEEPEGKLVHNVEHARRYFQHHYVRDI